MRSNRWFILLWTIGLIVTPPLSGQGRGCFRGRQAPICRSFFLTEAGGNHIIAPAREYRTEKFQFALGWMRNRSSRAAVGAALFLDSNLDDESYLGVQPRYRRWISPGVGLDVGLGPRVDTQTGRWSASGQVGLSVGDWVSLTTQLNVGTDREGDRFTWQLGARLGSYAGVMGLIVAPLALAAKSFGDSFSGF